METSTKSPPVARLARRRALGGLGLALLLGGCGRLIPAGHQTRDPARLPAGQYRLDPDHAALLFRISHLGFSDFVGRFGHFDASLDFDAAAPEAARLEASVEVASLQVMPEGFDRTLLGPDWFDAAQYPEMRFVLDQVEVMGEEQGRAAGRLTLKGVTQPIELQVAFRGGAANLLTGRFTLGFRAEGSISRSAFGIDRLVPAIGDEVRFEIEAEFLRQDA